LAALLQLLLAALPVQLKRLTAKTGGAALAKAMAKLKTFKRGRTNMTGTPVDY
jgi:hypothetical protein